MKQITTWAGILSCLIFEICWGEIKISVSCRAAQQERISDFSRLVSCFQSVGSGFSRSDSRLFA
nr:MAG TPA: hypothetical protein [Herelleviridae sp.]